MGARAVASGSISFGMINVPVKLYTSASSQSVRFSYFTEDGNRVKQQYVDAKTGDIVDRATFKKGYEIRKDEYVTFSPEELKALEAEKGDIEILEFVSADTIDSVYVEKSYYVGLEEKYGGDKAFQLLLQAMKLREVVAIGKYVSHGKEHLIMIRPYQEGLVMHHLFYEDEVRDYSSNCKEHEFDKKHLDMASSLIDQFYSDEFDLSQYQDEYSKRVREVAEQKDAGEAVSITVNTEKKSAADLFDLLAASIEGPKKVVKKKAKKKTSKKVSKKKQKKAS